MRRLGSLGVDLLQSDFGLFGQINLTKRIDSFQLLTAGKSRHLLLIKSGTMFVRPGLHLVDSSKFLSTD